MSLESLSEKQVQKEIGLLEKKMKAVHAEFESLNKRRTACYILLGEDPAPPFVAVEPVAADVNLAPKKNDRPRPKAAPAKRPTEAMHADADADADASDVESIQPPGEAIETATTVEESATSH